MARRLFPPDEVRGWPKVDLHCHLEGALRPQTVLELLQANRGLHVGDTVEDILPLVQVTGRERSFFDWLPIFNYFMQAIHTQDDLVRVTLEAVEDAARDGVVYLELRYAPFFISGYNGLPPQAIVEAVSAAGEVAAGRFATPVELILIAQQSGGEQECSAVLDLALAHRDRGHRAIDIAGDMTRLPLDLYAPIFTRARDAGLGITVHAGEVAPASTVRTAVVDLHATRIGHGIRSVEDSAVIDLLLERDVLLEVCVTSNLQTRVAASLESHPIRRLVDAGVRVCVNTDDPGVSAITLTDEYVMLLNRLGFPREQFARFNRNAIRSAFTDDGTRAAALAPIERGYA
jgi:adenosine deaminase